MRLVSNNAQKLVPSGISANISIKALAFATTIAIMFAMGTQAEARIVGISGTHTQSEINKKCKAAGGSAFSSSGGFGCDNMKNKGTGVHCDPKGANCFGIVPG